MWRLCGITLVITSYSIHYTKLYDEIPSPRTEEVTIRRRSEMLLAVDEGLGRIIAALDAKGVLDQTVIVLTSDNGFFYGEHGLTSELV